MKKLLALIAFAVLLLVPIGTQNAFAPPPLEEIDIDPGNDPNFINLLCPSPIPVAILSSPAFDAFTVDVTTLAFGPSGAGATGSEFTDVDGDGLIDLLSIYRQVETGIVFGDTEACLTGELLDGTPILECDSIVTIRNVCAVGGELIPLDTTMVLVAGTQTTAAWMIPVLVSAIGIGIVLARKF